MRGAVGSAQRVGSGLGAQGQSFIEEANKVFVDAMAIGMRVSVVIIAIAFVVAWKFLPARATYPAASPEEATAELGAEHDADSVAVAPPATATLSAGD